VSDMTAPNRAEEKKGIPVRIPDGVPPIAGYADSCALVDRGTAKEIVFFDSATQRALVRMIVDRGDLLDRLWATSVAFYNNGLQYLSKLGISPSELSDPPRNLEGPVPIASNVFRVFQSGTEAALEGYYVSPGDIHLARERLRKAKTIKPVGVIPQCHIQISLPLLLGLLGKVKDVAGKA
jgi:hypothetical protein